MSNPVLRELGLSLRVVTRPLNPSWPFEYLQMNYGEVVLWRVDFGETR